MADLQLSLVFENGLVASMEKILVFIEPFIVVDELWLCIRIYRMSQLALAPLIFKDSSKLTTVYKNRTVQFPPDDHEVRRNSIPIQ